MKEGREQERRGEQRLDERMKERKEGGEGIVSVWNSEDRVEEMQRKD